MHFDFEALLTLATIVTGLVWLVDAVYFAPRRRAAAPAVQEGADAPAKPREPMVVDYSKSFFPVILLVLLLRSFLAEPFHIPSSSMVPTLLIGDFILVNKYDYGVRLPVLHTKIIKVGEPKRGDVAVFRYPNDPSIDYIKRIVGLPGDHIVYRNKTLYINGVEMQKDALGPYTGPDADGALLGREHLGNVTHEVLTVPGQYSNEGEWTVPEGEYFAMGDNRDNSSDSRYWGFVPEQNLVGRAFFIWMNWDAFRDSSLWHRVGNVIH
ncbi:MAG TPA: signal peptidase I [Gammaproteobacteria bacterium]|jgi:signal peptidase I|nr:signal peptidase I [Gammaproteobacteria bacterium]